MKKLEIISNVNDKVLNVVSQQISEISFSYANKLLRQKDIRVNNKKVSENVNVFVGDEITLFVPETALFVESKKIKIMHYDDKILIAFKPKGMEVVGEGITLISELVKQQNNKNLIALNRLDRNTEGLTLFANGKKAYDLLKSSMKKGEITKVYLAEVVGSPNFETKNKISYLIKDEEKSEVKIFEKPVKDSVKIETFYHTISRSSGGTSLIQAEIKNGKTHQIRAQLASMGYPIVGDGKYGKNADNKKFKTKTQKLTCVNLIFSFKDKNLTYLNDLVVEQSPTWLNV